MNDCHVSLSGKGSDNSTSCLVSIHTSKEIQIEKVFPNKKRYDNIYAHAVSELVVTQGKVDGKVCRTCICMTLNLILKNAVFSKCDLTKNCSTGTHR